MVAKESPSREGLVSFTWWTSPETRTAVKRLALDTDRTVADLMDEAVRDLLKKHQGSKRK